MVEPGAAKPRATKAIDDTYQVYEFNPISSLQTRAGEALRQALDAAEVKSVLPGRAILSTFGAARSSGP